MAGESGEMFAAVKGAVMAFTRSLARSLAPQVRVNCVAPGWIKTAWGESASDTWQQRAASESLLERWGTPEDVARVVAFLASPAADFVTGQVLAVNGGRSVKLHSMPRDHIHFVTGRLAEFSLRSVLAELAPRSRFRLFDRRAADHRGGAHDARLDRRPHPDSAVAATRVLVPGYCQGDLQPISAAVGMPVERGPRDLRRLAEFFGHKPPAEDYGQYDIEILAEINHAPRLTLARNPGRSPAPRRLPGPT